MRMNCPHCGAEFEIAKEYFGRRAECESCGNRFIIGQTSFSSAKKREANEQEIPLGATHKASLKDKPPKRVVDVASKTKIIGVVVAILAIVSAAIILVIHNANNPIKFVNGESSEADKSVLDSTMFSVAMRNPRVGRLYVCSSIELKVKQVFDGYGIIACSDDHEVFIRTKNEYVDKAPIEDNLYSCFGKAIINTPSGPKTLWAFDMLSAKAARKKVDESLLDALPKEFVEKSNLKDLPREKWFDAICRYVENNQDFNNQDFMEKLSFQQSLETLKRVYERGR